MMMARRKRSRWWLWWLLLVVVAVLVVIAVWKVYFERNENGNNGENEQTSSTVTETKATEGKVEIKKATEEKVDNGEGVDEEGTEHEKVKQYEGDNPNKSESISGVITYAGVNDGTLVIRVNIDQYIRGGKCKLAIARGETVIYGEAVEVMDSAATATCAGFDVPVDRIGNGKVNIVIGVEGDGKNGEITKEVEI